MIKNGYKPLFLELDKEMQLIAANSFLREIGRIGAENDHGFSVLKRAVGILEAEEGMLGLDEVIGSISQSDPRKIVLKSYL